jgi:hypothetical protein
MSEVLASALCLVQDRDMRCWLTLEADPEDYFPTLTVVAKCCVLWCHSRSAGTAGVPTRLEDLAELRNLNLIHVGSQGP